MDVRLLDLIETRFLLHPKQVSNLLRTFKDCNFEDAGIGYGKEAKIDKNVRNVTQYQITRNEKSNTEIHYCNFLINRVKALKDEYLKKHWLEQANGVECINILKYEVGGKYELHIDSSNDRRKYSVIIFLNNDYKGGRLEFVYRDQTLQIEPYPGKAIIWPSNLLFKHGVRPVEEGTRYTIVSWICQ